MMRTPSRKYWETRAASRMYGYMQTAEQTADDITAAYRQASEYLTDEAKKVLRNYQELTGVSETEARRLLASHEEKNVIDRLKRMAEGVKDPEAKARLTARINAPAYSYRIERLCGLKGDIEKQCHALYGLELKTDNSFFQGLCRESYTRSMYDIQRGTGLGFSFSSLPKSRIQEILNQTWSGKHYSTRIWGNTQELAKTLKNEMLVGVMTGRAYGKTAAAVAEKMGVGAMEARRLVRTESCYIANQAELESYRECGVDRYRFSATLDMRTSEICRELDNRVFSVEDGMPGVNMPPMHPWCRSTTIVELDGEFTNKLKRRARHPKTGKTITVPANASYNDWKEQFASQDADAPNTAQKAAQAIITRGKIIDYSALPDIVRSQFDAGLKTADLSVKAALEQEIESTRFHVSENKKSYYIRNIDYVQIHKATEPGTLAHELFHRIDAMNKISRSGELKKALDRDFRELKTESRGNIAAYLRQKYPQMWVKNAKGAWVFKKEYRGISDIFSGLSKDSLNFGYHHEASYWEKDKYALSREAWAQFGRIGYDNDPKVVGAFKTLFPRFWERAIMTLKELV